MKCILIFNLIFKIKIYDHLASLVWKKHKNNNKEGGGLQSINYIYIYDNH
jgi:hypothetical protein